MNKLSLAANLQAEKLLRKQGQIAAVFDGDSSDDEAPWWEASWGWYVDRNLKTSMPTPSPQPVRQTDTELSLCSNRSGSCVREGFVGGIFMASTVANSTEVNSLP